jgi:hypothetical protein
MLATLTSAALVGIDAVQVQVEVNANERGEPRLILLGLPDAAVKESIDRVLSALAHCGFIPLRMRTTVNLAPGGLRKEGPLYDLPIALALLACEEPPKPVTPLRFDTSTPATGSPDFSEIKGQRAPRRAIEVTCSGSHNLLMLCIVSLFGISADPNMADATGLRRPKVSVQPCCCLVAVRTEHSRATRPGSNPKPLLAKELGMQPA